MSVGPLVAFRLEATGDDTNAMLRDLGLSPAYPVWVAEIVGTDPRFGLARRFLPSRKDYAKANSVGSRGVYLHYALRRGRVYEVRSMPSWKGGRRWFLRVTEDGEKVEMTREEVLAWLAARSA